MNIKKNNKNKAAPEIIAEISHRYIQYIFTAEKCEDNALLPSAVAGFSYIAKWPRPR